MQEMSTKEGIPMAIQADTRGLHRAKNLVLYVDILNNRDDYYLDSFMAGIYEADKKGIDNFPKLPTNEAPLLYSSGTGLPEWEATFAFVDFLFQRRAAQSIRAPMEKWLLQTQAMQASSYTICSQIRHEGLDTDISQPTNRLASFVTRVPPGMVPPAPHTAIEQSTRELLRQKELDKYGKYIVKTTPYQAYPPKRDS